MKECNTHVPLLMPPLKHLLSLSRLPTHPRLPLLRPFSLPGVYFSSGQTIRQILYPGDSSWVIRAQTATTKTNIFFIVLHSMIHFLQSYLCVFLFLFRRFLAVALPLLCRGKGGSKTFLLLLESIKRATLFFFASLESQQCFQWQLSCPFTPYS